MMVAFTVPGQPVAKGRPRFARRGAHVVAYTDAKTASYENLVKMAAKLAMCGTAPTAAPIVLSINLDMQIPASWSKKRRELAASGAIAPTKKPDVDNVLKGIKDGCNGIIWNDDAQVVRIMIAKRYSETPGAMIKVAISGGEAA